MGIQSRTYSYFSLFVIFFIIVGAMCKAKDSISQEWVGQRELMVESQVRGRGIGDKDVLDALRKVERHKFVPDRYRAYAYKDHPLPIGEGQTISQPYIVALMTEVLDLDHKEKVLEVGTGSGYQAAVLAEICDSVYTIEINEVLGKGAKERLAHMGYANIKVKIGDGYQGWKEHSPFDAIIVTCAPSHIPRPLKEQLAEGGKMVIPVGKGLAQRLVLLAKEGGKIEKKDIIPVRFVPMVRKDGKSY